MHTFFTTLWTRFTSSLRSIPFVEQGLMKNEGLWMHLLGGGLLAKLFIQALSSVETTFIILILAIVWEIFEAYLETPNEQAMINVYGSVRRYWYDTVGDIIGTVAIAALVVF